MLRTNQTKASLTMFKTLLLVSLVLCVAIHCEGRDLENSDTRDETTYSLQENHAKKLPELDCDRLLDSEESKKICHKVDEAIKRLEIILRELAKGVDGKDPKLGEMFQEHIVERVKRLQEMLSKLNMNSGFPALMESFRVFGIPISKLYALYLLLDPFEI